MHQKKSRALPRPAWLKTFQIILLIIMTISDGILIAQAFQNRRYLSMQVADFNQEIERIDIEIDDPQIVREASVIFDGKEWTITMEGLAYGETGADLNYIMENGEIQSASATYGVTASGFLYCSFPYIWSGWKELLGAVTITITIVCILLFSEYIFRNREDLYSHTTPQIGGLALFTLIVSLFCLVTSLLVFVLTSHYNATTFDILVGAIDASLGLLMPIILCFAFLLSLSNLFLIAREGFRFVNLLGILLSILVVFGVWFLLKLGSSSLLQPHGPTTQLLKKMFYNLNTLTIYGLCFMLAVMISGAIAALRVPRRNADYIIILGCGIKPDGTLYPLIKSRVDRAIWFWKKQVEETGKKAVFVPSGGKGSDEIISEGEAMKNYLLSQGFKEEDILAETGSVNTFQNMAFSKKLIEEQKKDAVVVFSTSNYHVFRSGIFAKQAGLKAAGLGSRTKWYFWPNAFVREFVGMMAASWKLQLIIFGLLFLISSLIRIMI